MLGQAHLVAALNLGKRSNEVKKLWGGYLDRVMVLALRMGWDPPRDTNQQGRSIAQRLQMRVLPSAVYAHVKARFTFAVRSCQEIWSEIRQHEEEAVTCTHERTGSFPASAAATSYSCGRNFFACPEWSLSPLPPKVSMSANLDLYAHSSSRFTILHITVLSSYVPLFWRCVTPRPSFILLHEALFYLV